MDLWNHIASAVAEATGEDFAPGAPRSLGGGCINAAYRLEGEGASYFVKVNRAAGLEMFEAEADGLREMGAAPGLRIPRPVCTGSAAGQAYLVMEYLPLGGRGDPEALGRGLSGMHRVVRPEFGWWRDNTIGDTPQPNGPEGDWVTFWRRHRLGFQLELAARNGHGGRLQQRGERLLAAMDGLFRDHRPEASLLHGDLWSGNYGYTGEGEPVLYDPAVYFGDREADLAMTELFGGFPRAFYAAYREAWPLDPGYEVRRTFYNLYHVINHLNLFGGGYATQAQRMTDQVLAELG